MTFCFYALSTPQTGSPFISVSQLSSKPKSQTQYWKLVKLPSHRPPKREAKNEVIFFAMDFSKKNRERKRTIGKSEPRRMEPKIDEAALDAKIAAIREANRHFFLLSGKKAGGC